MNDVEVTKLVISAKLGDKDSKSLLIQDNMRYIKKIVNSFYLNNRNLSVEDLMQEGIIAVIKAINSYDSSKKVKFSTYVYSVVNFTLISEIKKKYSYFKIPEHEVSKILKFKKRMEALKLVNESCEYGCKRMGLSYRHYTDMLYLSNINNLAYLNEIKSENSKICLGDMIAYEDMNYKKVEDRIDLKSILTNSNNDLSHVEKYILRKILIEDEPVKDISKRTKIPTRKISNIKYNALKKIKFNVGRVI